METLKFKTNIKCMGCVGTVTPHLNQALGENNWDVDINNPSKVLTVKDSTQEKAVREAVEKAGFKAERL